MAGINEPFVIQNGITLNTIEMQDTAVSGSGVTVIIGKTTGDQLRSCSSAAISSFLSLANSATVSATTANTANTIVARDASGNFTAGTITATAFSGGTYSGSGSGLTSIPNSATTATSTNTANTIVARDASGGFAAGVITATSTNARYADLAEKYTADDNYEPGTVVEFGGREEVTLSAAGSRKIAGVVSTNPAYLMNSELSGRAIEVALLGRVPCKVKGQIEKGDMLVSAGGGYAKASLSPLMGQVIGKSLENFDGSEGIIEVVVGRM